MRYVMSIGLLLAGALAAGNGVATIQLDLTRADIERAVATAKSSEAHRAQFHAAYQVPVTDDFVEKLEVITEYRRMVLIAEQRLAAGEWAFGLSPRSAEDALQPWKHKVSIRARIRFPPHNVYPRLPLIDITMGAGREQLTLLHTMSEPQYALGNYAGGFAPLMGALVESDFDAVKAGQRTLEIVVHIQGGSEVHRSVNFGSLK
jgi:hypothetical protein